MKVAVIGIGQSLRGDDAAGLEAVREWRERYPETANRPEVRTEASEIPGLGLIDLFDDAEAVVLVDAIKTKAKPGTVHRITPNEVSAFTSDAQSAHGWGAAETLQLHRSLHPEFQNVPIVIIGIEADGIEMGFGLSEPVQNALPMVCAAIEKEVLMLSLQPAQT